MDINYLITNGIAYDEGVERLMGNAAIYENLLMDFTREFSFEQITQAYNTKDFSKLLERIHALKGISGSLGLNKLYEKCCAFTEILRSADYSDIDSMYSETLLIYEDTVSIIEFSYSHDK